MSEKQVILHIGSPKVGSTALQTFLYKNREHLKQQGCDYQFFDENKQDWRISRGLTGGDIWKPIYPKMDGSLELDSVQFIMLQNVFNRAAEQLKSCNKLFISNEFLYFLAQDQKFWRLCEELGKSANTKISIVMYLRNPFDFLDSWYSESAKRGFTVKDFSEYLTSSNPIFDSIYRKLPQLLENSDEFSIPVYLFGTQDYGRDIPSHFISLFGVDASRLLPPAKANQRLSLLELEFFKGLHSISRDLGYIFCNEVTDSYLNSIYTEKVRSEIKPRITRSSSLIVAENLLEVKYRIADLHPTLAALSYEIPSSFLLPPFDSDTEELLAQAFEIGVMCGRSFKGGYLARRLR